MKVQVIANQSLADIAIQEAGGIEGLFAIAALNSISITDAIQGGTELMLPAVPANRDVAGYYASRKLRPATWVDDSFIPSGIEFWGIEFDFIVS